MHTKLSGIMGQTKKREDLKKDIKAGKTIAKLIELGFYDPKTSNEVSETKNKEKNC